LPEDGAGEEMAEEVGVEPPADGLRPRQDGVARVLTLVAPAGELAQAAAQKARQLLQYQAVAWRNKEKETLVKVLFYSKHLGIMVM
jgi:hypothetical protein